MLQGEVSERVNPLASYFCHRKSVFKSPLDTHRQQNEEATSPPQQQTSGQLAQFLLGTAQGAEMGSGSLGTASVQRKK